MKRILWVFFVSLLFLTGCNGLMNTPTKKVETLLSNYQKKDSVVLQQLKDTILLNENLNNEEKEIYEALMQRQYEDLTYLIKNETIDGKTAVVEVEIEVYDYNKAITESESYLLANAKEFQDSKGEVDNVKYNDYKLKKMQDVDTRIKYTINFTLSKDNDNEWLVDDLTEAERLKIHGLYAY